MRIVPLLALGALIAGCSSGLKRPVVTATAEPDAQGVQRVVVEMHSFYFKPNRIVVHAGHPVELVLKNKARWVPHTFTIEQPPLQVSARAWLGTGHLRFTPTTPGEYMFHCEVDSHEKKGMTGTLVVSP